MPPVLSTGLLQPQQIRLPTWALDGADGCLRLADFYSGPINSNGSSKSRERGVKWLRNSVKNANNLIPVVCATMTRRVNAPRRLTFRTVPNGTARAPHLSRKVVRRPGRQKSNPEPAQFCAETAAIKPRAF